MKTKPIDYTGCHPEIAECLKRSEAVLCRVWGYGEKENYRHINPAYIYLYQHGEEYPYFVSRGDSWKHAEPVKTVTKVKKASEIVKWLEDNGFYVNSHGHWICCSERVLIFNCSMFQFCGEKPNCGYTWLPEWLEEVEE